jgi:hypothetical protein
MKTFRNSGNQKSDLTNFTATIQAVLNNGSMAGYFIGRLEENLYGLFGYKINFDETEVIEDQVLGYGENRQHKIGERISETNEEERKTEKIKTIQGQEVAPLEKQRYLNQSHTEVGMLKVSKKPRSIDIIGEVIPNIMFPFVVFLFYYNKWNRVAFVMICIFVIYCLIHYSNRFRNKNKNRNKNRL